jgi:hypothetical protein
MELEVCEVSSWAEDLNITGADLCMPKQNHKTMLLTLKTGQLELHQDPY